VKAKDVFEEFYVRGLSRRLLLKKSASFETERAMISKLKNECGEQFTARAEGMMKDLNESEQVMKEFVRVKGADLESKYKGIETHFYVLGESSWPVSTQQAATLPPLLKELQTDFEGYYKSRFQGRCLSWCVQMGTCSLEARFSEKIVKTLELSCAQAVILLNFNQYEKIGYEQMQDLTGMSEDELKKQLISLSLMEH